MKRALSIIPYTALRNRLFHIVLLLFCATSVCAWDWWPLPMAQPDTCRDTLLYVGGVSAVVSSSNGSPTWIYGNRNGEISTLPYSGNIHLGIVKPATRPSRWFDYDGAVVLSGRIAGSNSEVQGTGFFSLLYAHARLYVFDITVGIKPIYSTLGDAELTAGDLLFSNNTHPIPRITIGIDHYTAFPGLYGYVEVRGGVTHGWLKDNNPYIANTLLHHKFIGGRIGGKWPVNLTYELHHAAQWGGYENGVLDLGNDWNSFVRVFSGKQGGATTIEQLNTQGNHMVSQLLCLTAKGEKWHIDLYWQDFQEDGAVHFIGGRRNSKDGRWGIHAAQDVWPFISGLTFECIQMTDQSGPWHDRDGMVFGGDDFYYSNGVYKQGWTYFGRSICSPLLSPTNSRVWAYHAGIKGDIYGYRYRLLCTYSDNYGTYHIRLNNHNTAVLLEVHKTIQKAWGLDFGIALGGDFGTLYGTRLGGMITISKRGIIKSW